ncbi:hypothetical protein [Marinobacterium stanieri]|uniref:Uncharacterized protein n=1 Tax=Marinobacterium stanieri TaxID=49186 RepID=A0A1N6TX02_9GAMM|nr:hypothetical protein [Marinobacterium stanieri]SIQ57781.1 hypothetical protein SAMN05421647_10670 [Marinobacterium stanieri]
MNYEQKLEKDLRQNETVIHVIEALTLTQEYQHTKGNLKSYTAATLDSITAARIIKELGFSAEKVEIRTYSNGKKYVIFKGYPGERKILKGTKYLVNNPDVVRLAIGPKGIVESAKSGFVISFILSSGLEVFDYLIQDGYTLSRLLGTLSSDLIKIGLASIAAAAAGLVAGSIAIIGSTAAVPLIAAIAVGIITGSALEIIDRRLGATKALIKGYEKIGIKLKEIEYEYNNNIALIERKPNLIFCLFAQCPEITGY